jgi:hypothetical protein
LAANELREPFQTKPSQGLWFYPKFEGSLREKRDCFQTIAFEIMTIEKNRLKLNPKNSDIGRRNKTGN